MSFHTLLEKNIFEKINGLAFKNISEGSDRVNKMTKRMQERRQTTKSNQAKRKERET